MKTTALKLSLAIFAGLCASAELRQELNAQDSKVAPVIVGYLPDYRVSQLDVSIAQNLTDIVFFSVKPQPNGRFSSPVLDRPETIQLLERLKEEFHVRIHLCIGGWNRSQGFAEIAATEKGRAQFAEGVAHYCQQYKFAGADLDWEHPKDATESTNYGLLLEEIAKTFKPRGLSLTAAMAGWQTLTPAGAKAVDAIHLMSYDGEGRHSTMEQAKKDVQNFFDAGLPLKKIRLGLPFYGRGIRERELTKTYAEIATRKLPPETDEVDGIYFNGPKTIQSKTRFARDEKLGGVMVWEIGQDAPGDASLLKVIHSEMAR